MHAAMTQRQSHVAGAFFMNQSAVLGASVFELLGIGDHDPFNKIIRRAAKN